MIELKRNLNATSMDPTNSRFFGLFTQHLKNSIGSLIILLPKYIR